MSDVGLGLSTTTTTAAAGSKKTTLVVTSGQLQLTSGQQHHVTSGGGQQNHVAATGTGGQRQVTGSGGGGPNHVIGGQQRYKNFKTLPPPPAAVVHNKATAVVSGGQSVQYHQQQNRKLANSQQQQPQQKLQKSNSGDAVIFLPLYSVRMDGSKMQLDFANVDATNKRISTASASISTSGVSVSISGASTSAGASSSLVQNGLDSASAGQASKSAVPINSNTGVGIKTYVNMKNANLNTTNPVSKSAKNLNTTISLARTNLTINNSNVNNQKFTLPCLNSTTTNNTSACSSSSSNNDILDSTNPSYSANLNMNYAASNVTSGTVSKRTKLALRKIVTVSSTNRPSSMTSSSSTNQNLNNPSTTNRNLASSLHFNNAYETYSAPNTPNTDESYDSFGSCDDVTSLNSASSSTSLVRTGSGGGASLVRIRNARTLLAEKLKKQKQQLQHLNVNNSIGGNRNGQNANNFNTNNKQQLNNPDNAHFRLASIPGTATLTGVGIFANNSLMDEQQMKSNKKFKQFRQNNSTPASPIGIQVQQNQPIRKQQQLQQQNLRKFSLNANNLLLNNNPLPNNNGNNNAIHSGNNVIQLGSNGLSRGIYESYLAAGAVTQQSPNSTAVSGYSAPSTNNNASNYGESAPNNSIPNTTAAFYSARAPNNVGNSIISTNNDPNLHNALNDYDFYLNFNKPPDSSSILDDDLLSTHESPNQMASATFSGNSVLELDDPFISGGIGTNVNTNQQQQNQAVLPVIGYQKPVPPVIIDKPVFDLLNNSSNDNNNFIDFLDLTENHVIGGGSGKDGSVPCHSANEEGAASVSSSFPVETNDSVENVCNAVLASCLGPRSHVLTEGANQIAAWGAMDQDGPHNFNKAPVAPPHGKKTPHVSSFCGFTGPDDKNCRQRCINGYKFCIRHILKDSSAPYKACAHMRKAGSKSIGCMNAVLQQKDGDPKYCGTHLIMMGMREPKAKKKKKTPAAAEISATPAAVTSASTSAASSLVNVALIPSSSNQESAAAMNQPIVVVPPYATPHGRKKAGTPLSRNAAPKGGPTNNNTNINSDAFSLNSDHHVHHRHVHLVNHNQHTQRDTQVQDPFHQRFTIIGNNNNATTLSSSSSFLQSPDDLVKNNNGGSYNSSETSTMVNGAAAVDPNDPDAMLFDDPGQYFLLEPSQIQQQQPMNDGLGAIGYSATPTNQNQYGNSTSYMPQNTGGICQMQSQMHQQGHGLQQQQHIVLTPYGHQQVPSQSAGSTPNSTNHISSNVNNNADFASRPESQLSGID